MTRAWAHWRDRMAPVRPMIHGTMATKATAAAGPRCSASSSLTAMAATRASTPVLSTLIHRGSSLAWALSGSAAGVRARRWSRSPMPIGTR